MWGKCWSALGSISAVVASINVRAWPSTHLILVAGAAGARREWMCFSGRMSHLGLDTLWCLKHVLKCVTPSTYLLAIHNNPGRQAAKAREGTILENLQGLMWRGASALTRIHEAVRHTLQLDFDSSNSSVIVLSSAVSNMWSWWKRCLFAFVSFLHFSLWFSVLIACHYFVLCVAFLCCCCLNLSVCARACVCACKDVRKDAALD